MTKEERFESLTSIQGIRGDLRAKSVHAALFTGLASLGDFAIRLGSTAVLARLVIPEHFGLVMMVTAVIGIADQLKEMGLSAATIQRPHITHAEVSNLFWINVSISALLALVVCACSPLIADYYREPRLIPLTCLLSLNFVFGGMLVQHQALLTRQLKLGHTSLVRLASSVLSTALAIGLAWFDYGYWALVWREVARSALLTVGMWFCLPWVPSFPCFRTDVRGLLTFGANVSAANLLGALTGSVDRFLIGRFWGAAPVGVFRQAYQLIAAPTDQLLSPLYQVSQPALSMLQGDSEKYRRFYQRILTIVCLVTMPISVVVAVYSEEVTRLLLGPKWMECAPIIMILSMGTFVRQAVGSSAFILITRGESRTYLLLTLFGNITFVVFMCIGVYWGIVGVAIADVAATFALIYPRLYYSLRNSPVSLRVFFSTTMRPLASSLILTGSLILLHSGTQGLNASFSLALGCLAAALVFLGSWVLIPGGKAELTAVATEVTSVLRRKLFGAKSAVLSVA